MLREASIALLVIGLIFSGCVGGQGDAGGPQNTSIPDQADPASFDESTGAITGLVTDDQIQPIPGAQVALLELPEKTTLTDVGGRFTISEVAPGTYRIAAQALGYESVARSVDVVAGEARDIQLVLVPIAVAVPYPQTFIWDGFIGCSVAYVRSVLQLSNGQTCPGSSAPNKFFHEPFSKGWPVSMKSLSVEAMWRTRDFLGFDINQRDPSSEMYARVRQESPVHLYLERCGDYTKTHFGRQPFPCTDEQLEASKMHIETWYVGQYQQETHTLDPVCQQSTPYWPAYQQGCYGVGVGFDLRWTNYVTVHHHEPPAEGEKFTALPDG